MMIQVAALGLTITTQSVGHAASVVLGDHGVQVCASGPEVSREIDPPSVATDRDAVLERLGVLISLGEGWDGPRSVAPSVVTATIVEQTITSLMRDYRAPRPRLFPTPEGGIQAEWVLGQVSADACFSPDGLVECSAVHGGSLAYAEASLAVSSGLGALSSRLADWLSEARGL